jgi:6-phosphogluconolactonase (cycloisomerase 2 family)
MVTFYTPSTPSQQRRLVLRDLGGVSKTQITAYAYSTYSTGRYKTVLWAFAVDEQELIKSFTELAKTLGLFPRADATDLEPKAQLLLMARRFGHAIDVGW